MGVKKLFNIYEKLPDFLEWISEEDIAGAELDDLSIGPCDTDNTPNLTIDKVSDLYTYISNGGECIINPDLVGHEEFITQALKRYLGIEKNSLNLDGLSKGQLKEQFTLKLCDHLSIGEYSDVITSDAYLQKHNFVKVRNYLMKCLSYFSYLNKGDIAFIPIDIEYGFCENKFYIQMHANVQNFVKEYLISSFKEPDREHPYQSLLRDSYLETDFLEIVHLEGAGKIVISAVWFKEVGFNDFRPTLLLNNIKSYESKKEELASRPKVKIVKTTLNIPSTDLPGKSAQMIGGLSENKEDLINIVHVVEVIQRFRSSENNDQKIPLEELSASDLDIYSEEFENEVIKRLSLDQREYIIECLKNPDELEHLEKGIDQILSPFDSEAYSDSFSNNLDGLSADEVNDYVNAELEENETSEELDEEKWTVKRSEIVEKIRKQKDRTEKKRPGRIEMNSSFMNMISTRLNTSPERVKPMVTDLGNKSIENLVKTKIKEGENSSEGYDLEFERQEQKYKDLLKKEHDKNIKYKKIIDIMKGQISNMADVENKMKVASAEAKKRGEELSEKLQLDALKLELKKALSEVKNRESTIDKIRYSTDQIIKIKDTEITKLKKMEKTSPLAVASSKDEKIPFKKKQLEVAEEAIGYENPVEVILKAKEENKSLLNQIEVLQKRISHLNENMEKGSSEKLTRAMSQISKLKEASKKQTQILQEVREDKEKYTRMYKFKELEYSKLQDEKKLQKIEINNLKAVPKQKVVQVTENKTSPEKIDELVAEKMKAAKIKIRSYEQKIKFLSAQLDTVSKKGGSARNAKQSSKADGANILKLKQMETLKLKAEDALTKSLTDVAVAKKQAHGFKQELMTAKNKIAEFERKLGKKAS
jgi:hypothetical protein